MNLGMVVNIVFKKGQPPAKHKEGCSCIRCNPNSPYKPSKLRKHEDYICNEYINGRTIQSIADELKVTLGGIQKVLKRKDISTRPKGFQKGMKKFANGKNWGYQRKGIRSPNYIDGRSKFLGPARYGDDWDAIRTVVYLRDKFTCQDCGVNGIRLDIHHKIPYLFSGDNSIENLTTLCRSCHMKAEHRISAEFKEIKINIIGDIR